MIALSRMGRNVTTNFIGVLKQVQNDATVMTRRNFIGVLKQVQNDIIVMTRRNFTGVLKHVQNDIIVMTKRNFIGVLKQVQNYTIVMTKRNFIQVQNDRIVTDGCLCRWSARGHFKYDHVQYRVWRNSRAPCISALLRQAVQIVIQ